MAERTRLPNRRPILTVPIEDAATGKWHLTVGFDAEGACREIFLDRAHKAGSEFDSLVHDTCIIVSRELLQCGRSPAALIRNLSERPPSLFSKALIEAMTLEREHGPEMCRIYRLEEEYVGAETDDWPETSFAAAPPDTADPPPADQGRIARGIAARAAD